MNEKNLEVYNEWKENGGFINCYKGELYECDEVEYFDYIKEEGIEDSELQQKLFCLRALHGAGVPEEIIATNAWLSDLVEYRLVKYKVEKTYGEMKNALKWADEKNWSKVLVDLALEDTEPVEGEKGKKEELLKEVEISWDSMQGRICRLFYITFVGVEAVHYDSEGYEDYFDIDGSPELTAKDIEILKEYLNL